MTESEARVIITDAIKAVEHARSVRELHAKRTKKGSGNRETDIRVGLHALRIAMRPLRSEIGRYKGRGGEREAEIHALLLDTSDALQRERRKLWKMQARKARKKRK